MTRTVLRGEPLALLMALIFCAVAAHGAAPDTGNSLPATDPVYQPPRLKQPLRPDDYTGSREGRIHVELDISATGEITDARIAPGGFGQKHFATRALRRAKAARFEPARRNGMPVAVRGHLMIQPFMQVESPTKVSSILPARIDRGLKLIESGDHAGANAYFTKVLSDDVASALDYAELHHRLAMAYERAGEAHLALRAAQSALEAQFWSRPPITLPRELGMVHMRLAASLGLLAEARTVYIRLGGDSVVTPADATLAREWEATLRSTRPLVGKARLGEDGRWSQELSRRSFTIEGLKGSVSGAELSCDPLGARQPLELLAGIATRVPDHGAIACRLYVVGEPGSEFDVVETGEPDPVLFR